MKINDSFTPKEMRKCFTETLDKIMKTNSDVIVCDSDLANSSGEASLFKSYPDRAVNFGISESNMAAAACGLSLTGLKPIIHSFAPFVTRRIVDQVYVSLGFSKVNCLIYGSDPGYWSKYNGPTHTTFEDFAIMSSIPNMNVVAPSDAEEFKWILEYYAKNGGLYYVRVPRQEVPRIFEEDTEFTYGKSNIVKEGKDVAIITCGPELYDAINADKKLRKLGIDATIIDLFFIKPLDKELIRKIAETHSLIVTVENHNKIGGINQQIASILVEEKNVNSTVLKAIAVEDRYCEVGELDYLKKILNISENSIINTIMKCYF